MPGIFGINLSRPYVALTLGVTLPLFLTAIAFLSYHLDLAALDYDCERATPSYLLLCVTTYEWFNGKSPPYVALLLLAIATISFGLLGQFTTRSFLKVLLFVDMGYIAAWVCSQQT